MKSDKSSGAIIKNLLVVAGFLSIAALLYYLNIGRYFSLEVIQAKSVEFKLMAEASYIKFVVIFLVVFALCIAAFLPVIVPFTLLAGYLFGVWLGFAYSLMAAVVGCMISYLFIRYALHSLIRDRYKQGIDDFNKKIEIYGRSYILILHFMSIVPYGAINTLAALTEVPFWIFVVLTTIGSMPLIFICALAGEQLATMQSLGDIFSWQVVILLGLLAVLALVPVLIRRFKKV
ncbi:MAG: VTT domain-containing protein [Candidatus Dependentiae bacterium]|nr:VTT domain-containing protein [Candidatus Dependentiae bacterium]